MKWFVYLVETEKGTFICSVEALSQVDAFRSMSRFFDETLRLPLIGAKRRKLVTGEAGASVTLARNGRELNCYAGKQLWEAVGRSVEYQATLAANGVDGGSQDG